MGIKDTLASVGVLPSKRRGQNFLTHKSIAQTIVEFANISPNETVIEIGPGLGAITGEILKQTTNYYCIEVEPCLCAHIREQFPDLNPKNVICGDVRDMELGPLLTPGAKCMVIGNLPYSISTDVVFWTLKNVRFITQASFLLQREFSERLAAEPGGKEYGSITVQRLLYSNAELGPIIDGGSFYPAAKVDSRLIKLSMLDRPRVELRSVQEFELVVRAAFGTRRKTLLNALAGSKRFGDKQKIKAVLDAIDIAAQRRAETLNIVEFAKLANSLSVSEAQ